MRKPSKKQSGVDTNSRLQKFELRVMKRSELKACPYNPREIDDYAKKELKANVQRVGLLEPLVVNLRTNHVISGNQRLAVMDSLAESKDYELTVSVVNLDETAEKEQVLFLNNELCMGTYDVDELQRKIEKGLDYSKCGFTESDLEALLPSWDRPAKPPKPKPVKTTEPPYAVLVFRNRAANDKFLQMIGLSPFDKYVSGELLLELVKKGMAES